MLDGELFDHIDVLVGQPLLAEFLNHHFAHCCDLADHCVAYKVTRRFWSKERAGLINIVVRAKHIPGCTINQYWLPVGRCCMVGCDAEAVIDSVGAHLAGCVRLCVRCWCLLMDVANNLKC